MGTLFYGDATFEMDDRLLAHLQIIVSMKLRRGESFFLSWSVRHNEGGGRTAIWVDNGVPIRLRFSGSRPPTINREWAEKMALAANSNLGLIVTDEFAVPEENDSHTLTEPIG
ncbi:hypothetical protein [uncultured Microbacterium sp.]|uniref:DUF7882 family protein n=1 Tax=uncultured Microbacterium sp. TaxID=191216 RepID=UPI0035C9D853